MLTKIEDMKVRFDDSGELSSSDKSFIESNYERILSKRFSRQGCGQCYKDAFVEIYIHIKKNGIKTMGKFILKREVVLHIAGDSNVYTRANITDEVAVKYLRKYPQAISQFEVYPDDWENIKSNPISNPPIEDSEEQKEAQKVIVLEIAEMLKAGTSKNKIKEHYNSIEKIGEKNLTIRLLADLIKEAEVIIKSNPISNPPIE